MKTAAGRNIYEAKGLEELRSSYIFTDKSVAWIQKLSTHSIQENVEGVDRDVTLDMRCILDQEVVNLSEFLTTFFLTPYIGGLFDISYLYKIS